MLASQLGRELDTVVPSPRSQTLAPNDVKQRHTAAGRTLDILSLFCRAGGIGDTLSVFLIKCKVPERNPTELRARRRHGVTFSPFRCLITYELKNSELHSGFSRLLCVRGTRSQRRLLCGFVHVILSLPVILLSLCFSLPYLRVFTIKWMFVCLKVKF